MKKSLLFSLAMVAALPLFGCGDGKLSNKEEKKMHDIMTDGLKAPGGGPPKGAGQSKRPATPGTTPPPATGN